MSNLTKFQEANKYWYQTALEEIKNGCKESRWMWYIFPQMKGLGFSYTVQKYAIQNLKEAQDYLKDPILGSHLREISRILLTIPSKDPIEVMGYPDDLKLRSSMTLFLEASETVDDCKLFQAVLDKFYEGKPDDLTLEILREERRKSL